MRTRVLRPEAEGRASSALKAQAADMETIILNYDHLRYNLNTMVDWNPFMPDYNDDAVSCTGRDETLCQDETNVEGEMMRGGGGEREGRGH